MRKKYRPTLAGLMVFLFQAPRAFSQVRGYVGGHRMMGWGYGWGWFGGVLMVIFWAAVIVAIVALIRWLWGAGSRGKIGKEDAPFEILKKRYARGEINKEEFEQKKRDLST